MLTVMPGSDPGEIASQRLLPLVAFWLAVVCTREVDSSRRCASTTGDLELSALHLVNLSMSLQTLSHQHT